MKNIILLIFILNISMYSSTFNFLNIDTGGRPSAFLGAYTGGDGTDSLLYNPAGSGVLKNFSFNLFYHNFFEDINFFQASCIFPSKFINTGISFNYYNFGNFIVKSLYENNYSFSVYDIMGTFNLSSKIYKQLFAGINIKFVYSHKSDEYISYSFLSDYGLLYKFTFLKFYNLFENNFNIGISFNNYDFNKEITYDKIKESPPYNLKIGIKHKPFFFFTYYLQFNKFIFDNFNSFSSGFEITPYNIFSITAGIKYDNSFSFSMGGILKYSINKYKIVFSAGWKKQDLTDNLYSEVSFLYNDEKLKINYFKSIYIFTNKINFTSDFLPYYYVSLNKTKYKIFNNLLINKLDNFYGLYRENDFDFFINSEIYKTNKIYNLKSSVRNLENNKILKTFKVKFKNIISLKKITNKLLIKIYNTIKKENIKPILCINTFSDKYKILVDNKKSYNKKILLKGEGEYLIQIYKNNNYEVFNKWVPVSNENIVINFPFKYKDNFNNERYDFWEKKNFNLNTLSSTNLLEMISWNIYAMDFKIDIYILCESFNDTFFAFGIEDKLNQKLVFFNNKNKIFATAKINKKNLFMKGLKNNKFYKYTIIYKDGIAKFFIDDIFVYKSYIDLSLIHKIFLFTKTKSKLKIKNFSYEILKLE